MSKELDQSMSSSTGTMLVAVWSLAALCVHSGLAAETKDAFWHYGMHADDWVGACEEGSEQSPVHILTDSVRKLGNPHMKARINTLGTVKGLKVFATENLVKVEVQWDSFVVQPDILVPAAAKDGEYFVPFDPAYSRDFNKRKFTKIPLEALQFHFHTPSEEVVNGKRSAAVVHIVHKVKPGYSKKCDEQGDDCLVVLAVMLDYHEDIYQDSHVLKPFLNTVLNKTGEKNGIELPDDFEFNLDDLLPENHDYMTWPGSLTTPPCTEGVLWLLFNDARSISETQVYNHQKTVAYAAGDDCEEIRDGKCFPPRQFTNHRPVQPLNKRMIKQIRY